MDTKKRILVLIKSKKHLGQHFLHDTSIARRIVDALSLNASHVLEIGPGMGILTKYLLERNYDQFTAIDIDPESIAYLKNRFTWSEGQNLKQADCLKVDWSEVLQSPIALIGNLPYNISAPIFFKLLSYRNIITEAVVMIQREVAERIVASEGSKTRGILSVLLQTFYEIELLFHVKPGSFSPPPKVHSSVLRLCLRQTKYGPETIGNNDLETLLFRVVKTAFQQRRKQLRNSLHTLLPVPVPNWQILTQRAEQLSVKQFIVLTEQINCYLSCHGLSR